MVVVTLKSMEISSLISTPLLPKAHIRLLCFLEEGPVDVLSGMDTGLYIGKQIQFFSQLYVALSRLGMLSLFPGS